MIKRALVAVAALAMGGTVVATVPRAQAATPAGVRTATTAGVVSGAANRSRIRWHRCHSASLRENGLKCGSLEVPLDYRHPHGRTVTLALTIHEHHSSHKRYLGAVLVNPGGPGGSGRIFATLGGLVPHGVGKRFDWIGFDPRGVGASTPALHCKRSYFKNDRRYFVPTNPSLMRHWRTVTRKYARACGRSKARRLLRHLTTRDSARDMNRIRKALGKRRISYYGFSYGSYLGQVFATMYPRHVKRMVLDGIVDPSRVWYGANFDQDVAFDTNMDTFWKWVARGNAKYHLGTDWTKIRAGYYRELAKLRISPAAGGRLGPDELTDAMLDAAYYVFGWRGDAAAYAALVNHHKGGRLLHMYRSENAGSANENGYAMYLGVECVDHHWPGWKQTIAKTRRTYAHARFMAWDNTWYNAPCIKWPVKAHRRVHVRQKKGLRNFLLVSETRDAATPYSGALHVRRLFPKARLLAGVGGTTHASSLEGVGCTDDRIATYLATGRVPARRPGNRADVNCPPYPQPSVSGRVAARSGQGQALRNTLRKALAQAQRPQL